MPTKRRRRHCGFREDPISPSLLQYFEIGNAAFGEFTDADDHLFDTFLLAGNLRPDGNLAERWALVRELCVAQWIRLFPPTSLDGR